MIFFLAKKLTRTYLKNNLSAHGGVAKRFKMLIPPSGGALNPDPHF
jgi:hypothetical protein